MNQIDDLNVYEIQPTDKFNDDMKYYIKKKKFTRIENDIENILECIEKGIFQGDIIADLGLYGNVFVYKERASNSNTNVGKSNGYRLIYYVVENDRIIYLITIYYKKDTNRIPTDCEIKELIEKYCN